MKLLTSLLSFILALPLAAQIPQPTTEHQKLAEFTGVWDATLDYMDPDGKPVQSKGSFIRKQPLGGFWLVDKFQAQIMGMQHIGLGTTGYDPVKKKYVSTWIDSMSPSLIVTEGTFDKSGKVLTMTGMGPGANGTPVKHRVVTTIKNKNTHVIEMFTANPEGQENPGITITHKRRVKVVDKVPGK
jgi:hypothetical protein